jgi:hypothetical protein
VLHLQVINSPTRAPELQVTAAGALLLLLLLLLLVLVMGLVVVACSL